MEIIPARVVEICPVFVVEICPVFVVEICPDLAATNVGHRAVTNNAAQVTDLRFFIALLLMIRSQVLFWSAWEFAAKPLLKPTSDN
jgi:hypothetical protein